MKGPSSASHSREVPKEGTTSAMTSGSFDSTIVGIDTGRGSGDGMRWTESRGIDEGGMSNRLKVVE